MKLNLTAFLFLGLFAAAPLIHAEDAPVPAVPETPAEPAVPATPPGAPAIALDFGDQSSTTLTTKAWDAYNAKNHADAAAYARKCIDLYRAQAVEMQKTLAAPATEKEEIHKSWALNDVGTCHFILGQALEAQAKSKEAIEAYKFLVNNLSNAQTYDAKGWFWKPAEAARERIKALEFDTLDAAE